jgi:hypothetical protein
MNNSKHKSKCSRTGVHMGRLAAGSKLKYGYILLQVLAVHTRGADPIGGTNDPQRSTDDSQCSSHGSQCSPHTNRWVSHKHAT